jgi:hypothetical protein
MRALLQRMESACRVWQLTRQRNKAAMDNDNGIVATIFDTPRRFLHCDYLEHHGTLGAPSGIKIRSLLSFSLADRAISSGSG